MTATLGHPFRVACCIFDLVHHRAGTRSTLSRMCTILQLWTPEWKIFPVVKMLGLIAPHKGGLGPDADFCKVSLSGGYEPIKSRVIMLRLLGQPCHNNVSGRSIEKDP